MNCKCATQCMITIVKIGATLYIKCSTEAGLHCTCQLQKFSNCTKPMVQNRIRYLFQLFLYFKCHMKSLGEVKKKKNV